MPVVCLSFHATYRCRHSGACCTSGWAIPVEPALRARLDAALAKRTLRLNDLADEADSRGARSPFVEDERLSDGSSILRVAAGGACTCYDPAARRCRIHAQLGHDALPTACQHFPRVCLIDRDATSVTLSHYCPTAARMLFTPASPQLRHTRAHEGIQIVEAPPEFAPVELEGLDARDALPPLLRPRMLADRESYRSWEERVLQALNTEETAEAALATVIQATETLRDWDPRRGPLVEAVGRAFGAKKVRRHPRRLSAAAVSLDALVRQCVPDGLVARAAPASATDADAELVAPRLSEFEAPVRRYLASRAFGNWCAYQGRGLRTVVCSLVAAWSVLRMEAVRHCAAVGRTLDEPLLAEAFRSADLLLVHLASREDLARRLGAIEEAGPGEMREALGIEDSDDW